MTIERDFLELMTQTVAIRPFTGSNDYGEPEHGTAVEHSARVVDKQTLVRDKNGREVVSTSQTWLFGAPGVTSDDKITLADGSKPVILTVKSYPDENGAHHQAIFT